MNDFDFEKIKPAVEEISLNDIQKAQILNACKGKRRQKSRIKPLLAAAAAVAVIAAAVFSPGFFMRANKSCDTASAEDREYIGEAENISEAENKLYSSAGLSSDRLDDTLTCPAVPEQFARLVDRAEFEKWESGLSDENGSSLAQFVKYFSIPREDFDRANAEYASENNCEPFDADLIYSSVTETTVKCYITSSEE